MFLCGLPYDVQMAMLPFIRKDDDLLLSNLASLATSTEEQKPKGSVERANRTCRLHPIYRPSMSQTTASQTEEIKGRFL